jgi:bifunctional DNA primase/polymerase-like protein/uncharacterized protein DUF5906/primase-like protein
MMLEFALRYASIGFHVFPLHSIRFDGQCGCGKEDCTSPGKHPRIKWKAGASCDPEVVRGYWTKWPNAGIGCATGPSGLLVADADGLGAIGYLRSLLGGTIPRTALARTARGGHFFYRGEGKTRSNPETSLDTRGVGGFVVLAPSPHASGHVYRWEVEPWGEGAIAEAPAALVAYSKQGARSELRPGGPSAPSWASGEVLAEHDFTRRLAGCLVDWAEVDRALAKIPPDVGYDQWVHVGMALHAAGDLGGRWDRWSARGEKYKEGETGAKWGSFKQDVGGIGLGTLFAVAREYGFSRASAAGVSAKEYGYERPVISPIQTEEPNAGRVNGHHFNGTEQGEFFQQFNSESPTSPLIRLNKDYAVIGNVGGKCLVLSWENSPIDERVKIPAFQSFKSFSERFGNEYVTVTKTKHLKAGDEDYEDQVQLGAYWLRWPERRTYEGIELAPNEGEVLPNGNYNLWQGFGVEARRGDWSRMRWHIDDVLAQGDLEAIEYITNWSAWCVQHPGERAEAALVLRGGKGTGKGVFLGALRRIFGSHGLQIFNRAHMIGHFNAHMRNCLFLFADEAYWAGDKQGESILKGLLSEPHIMLEQKGVDPVQWPNRMKVAMAANAAWVVPASDDERRYGVFDVSNERRGERAYFSPLLAEAAGGGLGAMLYDLLRMDLGDWHPRYVPQTKALQTQKAHSLPPLVEWWEGWLQEGHEAPEWTASDLMRTIREAAPGAKNLSNQRIARFLHEMGATRRRTEVGSRWKLPEYGDARACFERRYGKWNWES